MLKFPVPSVDARHVEREALRAHQKLTPLARLIVLGFMGWHVGLIHHVFL